MQTLADQFYTANEGFRFDEDGQYHQQFPYHEAIDAAIAAGATPFGEVEPGSDYPNRLYRFADGSVVKVSYSGLGVYDTWIEQ